VTAAVVGLSGISRLAISRRSLGASC